ncbi:MAG: putative rane protein putative virulence factor [Ilumatobacteraceae bacterium]|nr:putative rane protein putative virulence factor [Ilumatobacteraceae bacterium]
MTEEAPRTVRAAVGIAIVTAVSRIVGFARVLVVAAVLGTTYLGNAFQSANSISNVVFELVAAGALSAVLVPAFVDLLEGGHQREAEEVAGGVLGVAVTILGSLALIGVLAAPWLARLLTLGVPESVASEQRDLVAFLLVFFLPQVVLYAGGTVATGVLHAKRRFLAVAAAPMANTFVMVACLLAFRASTGGSSSLSLTTRERLLLAVAGTGGVVAFTGVLMGACRASGFRLRPRLNGRDPRVVRVLHQAGWGVVLHTSAGVLLGGAILAGAAVEGGVVAYQVAWVFFLAPYAIFAQPIQTAILPEWVVEARDDTLDRFATSVRWAVERIAVPVLPLTAAMVALAAPAMRLVSLGDLYAVAIATLALGLLPYAAFLLLARAFYALNDPKTPGKVALVVAGVGAVVMAVGAAFTHGTARIAVIGSAHTVAQVLGSACLVVLLGRRTGRRVVTPVVGLMAGISAVAGLMMWLGGRAILDGVSGRGGDVIAVLSMVAAGGLVVVALYAVTGVRRRLTERLFVDADPIDEDAVPAGGFT